MKVILLKEVRGVGKKNDVREVSDGYAKNFLIARGLAEAATSGALKKLQVIKTHQDKEKHEAVKRMEELKRIIEDRTIEFQLKTDERGTVFGSVTKEMILRAMREHNWLTKERVDIILERPIKEIGAHKVSVDLKHDITATLTVSVQPQQ